MGWGRTLMVDEAADVVRIAVPFPFNAEEFEPFVAKTEKAAFTQTLAIVPVVETPTDDNKQYLKSLEEAATGLRDSNNDVKKEALKINLEGILNNKLVNETARVQAGRLLYEIYQSEDGNDALRIQIELVRDELERAKGGITPPRRRHRV
jgi:hypothetical protein